MNRPSDIPLLQSSLSVYETFQDKLNAMRRESSNVADLLAIAAVADEIHHRIGAIRLKLRKLSVSVKASLS